LFLAGWKTADCQQVTALTPAQLQQAYFKSKPPSQCNTIAIIDPGTNYVTSALSDLAAYRAAFGLPAAQLALYNQYGQPLQTGDSSAPGYCPVTTQSTQILEQQLDLQMASAICPCCPLVYYAADSDASTDLFQAVQTAVANASTLNIRVVSISWGALESQAMISPKADSLLFNHTGLVFVAASGDTGYHVSYPASSQFVTAVGGTALNVDAMGNRVSEVLWTSGGSPGSGCSAYISRPAWQPEGACGNKRTVADVSATAGTLRRYTTA
jgi:subtilase family serine protease